MGEKQTTTRPAKLEFDFSTTANREEALFNFGKVLRKYYLVNEPEAESKVEPENEVQRLSRYQKAVGQIADCTLQAIGQMYEGEIVIATVRSRSGCKRLSLRPVYSRPNSLGEYFLSPDKYLGFDFTKKAFPLDKHRHPKCDSLILPRDEKDQAHEILMYGYDNLMAHGKHRKSAFSYRISKFLSELKGERDKYAELNKNEAFNRIGNDGYSLVFARCESNEILDIFAVYLVGKATADGKPAKYGMQFNGGELEEKAKRITAAKIVSMMFDALADCVRQDQLALRREALKAISQLIPVFSSREETPANAMMALAEKFNSIFAEHPFVGPVPWLDKYSRHMESKRLWLRFILIDSEVNEQDNTAFPSLRVYPKVLADKNILGAYQFAHKGTVSIVKLLLFDWLFQKDTAANPLTYQAESDSHEFKNILCSKQFEDLFAKTEYIQAIEFIKGKRDKFFYEFRKDVHCVIASDGDGSLPDIDVWKALNVDAAQHDSGATSERSITKTTAAFLLTRGNGGIDSTRYPYACLAFESAFPDAFSHTDLELLADLSAACGLLMSSLEIGVTQRNYATLLREAYSKYESSGSQNFMRFCFEINRMDPSAFMLITTHKDCIEKYWALGRPHVASNLKRAMPLINGMRKAWGYIVDGAQMNDNAVEKINKRFLDRLRMRLDKNKMRGQEFESQSPYLLEYLEAIPANSRWHAYLSAIPRALVERDAMLQSPVFFPFTPGHSAQHIFVLRDNSLKIRQIIKLGNSKNIKTEVRNYQRHVRFDVPLAARISPLSFAYESDGVEETATSNEFGVVVSDLIAGESRNEHNKKPLSFYSVVLDLLKPQHANHNIKDVLFALRHHFEKNVAAWKLNGEKSLRDVMRNEGGIDKDRVEASLPDQIRNSFNCPDKYGFFKSIEPLRDNEVIGNGIVTCVQSAIDAYHSVVMKTDTVNSALSSLNHKLKSYKDKNKGANSCVEFETLGIFIEEIYSVIANFAKRDHEHLFSQYTQAIAYIHGDLNGNNLTWASDYKRFFLIDFESVTPSYRGMDQIKLIAAFLSEAPGQLLKEIKLHPKDKWMKDCLAELLGLIKLMSDITAEGPMAIESNFPLHSGSQSEIYLPSGVVDDRGIGNNLNTVAFNILKTIPKGGQESWEVGNPFWRYALAFAFVKELEYAIRDYINEGNRCMGAHISDVTDAMRKVDISQMADSLFNTLRKDKDSSALRLVYSVLGVLACVYGHD